MFNYKSNVPHFLLTVNLVLSHILDFSTSGNVNKEARLLKNILDELTQHFISSKKWKNTNQVIWWLEDITSIKFSEKIVLRRVSRKILSYSSEGSYSQKLEMSYKIDYFHSFSTWPSL